MQTLLTKTYFKNSLTSTPEPLLTYIVTLNKSEKVTPTSRHFATICQKIIIINIKSIITYDVAIEMSVTAGVEVYIQSLLLSLWARYMTEPLLPSHHTLITLLSAPHPLFETARQCSGTKPLSLLFARK